MIEIILTILIVVATASGWLSYGLLLRIINRRDAEYEQYKRALEFVESRANQRMTLAEAEFNEKQDQVFAKGKQEGKRATLDWIKRQVDEGTLSVKVTGSPKK